ncbi:hypothetical protein [Streptomyces cinereoruber]|uniref:hypothetical protein n=1 Tax=Streptomyces cinereoruber TaxID=67260 RepID=UPI00363A2479
MSESASANLGGLYILVFLALFVGGVLWACHRFGPDMARNKRDREIETAMRIGLQDAETYDRIAAQIMREREGR